MIRAAPELRSTESISSHLAPSIVVGRASGGPRHRPPIAAVVGSSIIATMAVVAAFSTGLLSLPGSDANAVTSDAAIAAANGFAGSAKGGPWHLWYIDGVGSIDAQTGYLLPPAALPAGCNVTGDRSYSIPASTARYRDGMFAAWNVGYLNATGEMNVAVVDGRVTDDFAAWGGPCSYLDIIQGADGQVGVPSDIISSAEAASVALEDRNMAQFVKTHAVATATMDLIFLGGQNGWAWSLTYTTCDWYFTPGTAIQGQAAFVWVNATNGLIDPESAISFSEYDCVGIWVADDVPASDLLTLSTPVLGTCPAAFTFSLNGCRAGDYTYTLRVPLSYLPLGDIDLAVSSAGLFYNLPSPGGFSAIAQNGTVVSEFAISPGASMNMPDGFPDMNQSGVRSEGYAPSPVIPSNDTIVLDMGTVNPSGVAGLTLFATSPLVGYGYSTGSGNFTIRLTLP